MNAYPKAVFASRKAILVSVRSRVTRSFAFYGAAWFLGAALLSALHVAFPDGRPILPAPSPAPDLSHESGQSDPGNDSTHPIKAGPMASASPSETDSISENKIWAGVQKTESWAAYIDYIREFPNGYHVKEARERVAYIESFGICNQKHAAGARSEVCTEDLLINLIGSMDDKKIAFDWPALQLRFAKALFAAGVKNAVPQPDSGLVAMKDLSYDRSALGLVTITGLLYQFGSDDLKDAFILDGDKSGSFEFDSQIKPDVEKAIELYRKAAYAGDPNAAILLGFAYEIGSGVAKNNEDAIKLFKMAGNQVRAAFLLEKQALLGGSSPVK
jgi:TPR repeat protein